MTSTTVVDGLISSIGPYRVEELIGRGGMGEVYRAFDTRRNRTVALKVLPPETARDEHYRARFRRVSDSAARLQDPHVIPIHDFGEIDGRLFIDMRLVDGVGLDRLLADGPLDPHRAGSLIGQVAEALTDAHAHGVVHRDVKPSNILVTRSDFVYLVDFGIARSTDGDEVALTQTGQAVGTFAYMAPERFDGGPPDGRSDIYALACILAECLTGTKPFGGKSLPSLMKAHLLAEPPRPSLQRADVPRALDDVIVRGMAKDPDHRFQRAGELAMATQEALRAPVAAAFGPLLPAQRSQPAPVAALTPPAPTHHPPGVPPRRSRRVAASLAGLLAGALTRGSSNPGTRPPSYTYTVESNYPVHLFYTNSAGDSVQEQSATTPWSMQISTETWGADAQPSLQADTTSTKGDAAVTCTITDDQGIVVATDTSATAYASTICFRLG